MPNKGETVCCVYTQAPAASARLICIKMIRIIYIIGHHVCYCIKPIVLWITSLSAMCLASSSFSCSVCLHAFCFALTTAINVPATGGLPPCTTSRFLTNTTYPHIQYIYDADCIVWVSVWKPYARDVITDKNWYIYLCTIYCLSMGKILTIK